MEKTFDSSDKKTNKDNLVIFFEKENKRKNLKENYSKFKERTPNKWNGALKLVFNRLTGGKSRY